ncbi:lysM and putative peptidoglycan-binding domain-containing protein 1 [Nothoprocta perdicaria]|uniref:lysM and putative peptidoglycan-binding domain-containing protein 1 n=1 Tax=Nothoprocta perdicaria TaxID=30464 RepID=UPI000E1BA6B5|nr:lysM and putative peptidoglycan-binding domain-containing protein 1 [Nothoprocta perdicaria]
MEQIKRANRLYTSDTIFLKPTLLIPGQLGPGDEDEEDEEEEGASGAAGAAASSHPDVSAADFLQRIDADIRLRAAGTVTTAATRCPGPAGGDTDGARAAPRGALLGPRPLTRTPRAAALRDAEDEIFTL